MELPDTDTLNEETNQSNHAKNILSAGGFAAGGGACGSLGRRGRKAPGVRGRNEPRAESVVWQTGRLSRRFDHGRAPCRHDEKLLAVSDRNAGHRAFRLWNQRTPVVRRAGTGPETVRRAGRRRRCRRRPCRDQRLQRRRAAGRVVRGPGVGVPDAGFRRGDADAPHAFGGPRDPLRTNQRRAGLSQRALSDQAGHPAHTAPPRLCAFQRPERPARRIVPQPAGAVCRCLCREDPRGRQRLGGSGDRS